MFPFFFFFFLRSECYFLQIQFILQQQVMRRNKLISSIISVILIRLHILLTNKQRNIGQLLERTTYSLSGVLGLRITKEDLQRFSVDKLEGRTFSNGRCSTISVKLVQNQTWKMAED